MKIYPSSLKFSSVRQKWKQLEGLPRHRFKLSEKKNKYKEIWIHHGVMPRADFVNHILFTYSLCVQHCYTDKCVTSTCFSLRVNINWVNTTVQPKGNMPDHLYHGNMKCVCRSNMLCLTFIFLQTHVYMFLCLTICLFTIWSAVIIY